MNIEATGIMLNFWGHNYSLDKASLWLRVYNRSLAHTCPRLSFKLALADLNTLAAPLASCANGFGTLDVDTTHHACGSVDLGRYLALSYLRLWPNRSTSEMCLRS